VIDRINILEATRRAMVGALLELPMQPDCALVDAVALGDLPFPCLALNRGDAFSFAVACASILAKTERDALMEGYDRTYPGYGFASHKGYAVDEHRRALEELGPTPIHRLTFRSVIPRDESRERSTTGVVA
jgi:ribonuclease HII